MIWRHLLLGMTTLVICGCSYGIGVRVLGSLREGVYFESPSSDGAASRRIKVVQLDVQDRTAGSSLPVVWSVKGSASLKSVKYGSVPRGFNEVIAAQPLERGHTYFVRVTVRVSSLALGPPHRGGEQLFKVMEDGSISACVPSSNCDFSSFERRVTP
jgi:hypothetical protein